MSIPQGLDLPLVDQLEVTLIGPGYGESLVVHLGGGQWAVIDSCVRPGEGRSAALAYLDRLGVDLTSDVKLVVATHWHDDHIRGLATVVRECESATFVCSVALRASEFIALTTRTPPKGSRFTSGVREFAEIVTLLEKRKQLPTWATSSRRLMPLPGHPAGAVWALSPANGDIKHALQDFARTATIGGATGSIAGSDWNANHASVVILLEIDTDSGSALFGGDLEHVPGAGRGWHGVMADEGRPRRTASLYKVAHHGSITGHCGLMWSNQCESHFDMQGDGFLVQGDTVSILAPWMNGGGRLPRPEDLARLRELSRDVVLTKDVTAAFGSREDVEDTMAAMATYGGNIEPFEPNPGTIRCRALPDGTWDVQSVSF